MKRQIGLVRTCVIGAFLSTTALVLPGVQAQAGDLPLKAPAAAEPVPYWWFHGEVEAGGRFFLNNPQRNGSAYLNQQSLAKFYEYRDLRPGPFGNVWLSTGTSDGLYQIDFGAKNIGYNDQSYYLDASKAGEHYLSLGWDQSPHLYSTSALTPYQGIGTDVLTIPAASKSTTSSPSLVTGFNQTDIGIKRDTASAEYRWTPTDAWDINANVSHMRRTGTQVDGVSNGFSATYQVPKPVQDTTQNYGLNGEYAGTSPWGKKLTVKLAYNGSQYTDDYSSYTIQSPVTGSTQLFRESLWPSNNANAFSGTLGADLPLKSRYAGTLSYTMMRQNAAFIPESTGLFPALPATSLNGAINTLLSNNIITTKITPELTSKLSYRYYDFQNDTPEILFPSWTSYDRSAIGGTEGQIRSLSMAYTKQNGGADLNWRPTKEWNLGATYGYERYDWTRADVDVTNEHSGKVHADWKPDDWLTVRTSGYYGNRRYENYDYLNFVGNIQFPQPGGVASTTNWRYQNSYRQLMIDNRQTWKANLAVDMVIFPSVTLTPTFKYKDENYSVNPQNQQGLEDSRSWSAGLDATYVINPDTSIMVGYMREYYTQLMFACNTNDVAHTISCPPNANGQTLTNDKTVVDTFTALLRYAVIPAKFDTELRYTLSRGVDTLNFFITPAPAGGQFPDYTTWWQRLDATAIYTFDKAAVAQAGLTGVVKAKLHYAWERNSVSNWANDPVAPFNTWAGSALFMSYDNPNYNVHMLMASLAYAW
jgi:MtrB/PioB family decaheme-associated outer membrane protein